MWSKPAAASRTGAPDAAAGAATAAVAGPAGAAVWSGWRGAVGALELAICMGAAAFRGVGEVRLLSRRAQAWLHQLAREAGADMRWPLGADRDQREACAADQDCSDCQDG